MTEVEAHIAGLEPRRNAEAQALDRIFRATTGFQPKLHSGRMIGYGTYDYTYDSGHSGTSLATGFAMGKARISIYIMPGYTEFPDIMARLGKHKTGKSCVYLTRLEHANETALSELIKAGLADLETRWPIKPS
jgi:hypothetical protein